MLGKDRQASCRLCGVSLAPEEVYRLEVAFFERRTWVSVGWADGANGGVK